MNVDDLRGARGTLLPDARFNADYTRLYMHTASGIACYRGMRDEAGRWHGSLAGIADNDGEAQRFLEGAYVDLRT